MLKVLDWVLSITYCQLLEQLEKLQNRKRVSEWKINLDYKMINIELDYIMSQ